MRGHNEGSFYHKGDILVYAISIGGGKRKYFYSRAHDPRTEKQIKAELRKRAEDWVRGEGTEKVTNTISWTQLHEEWLATKTIKITTEDRYNRLFRSIEPFLTRGINEMDRTGIESIIRQAREIYSVNTVSGVVVYLRQLFKYAKRLGYVGEDLTEGISTTQGKGKWNILTRDDLKTLIQSSRNHPEYHPFLIAAMTGMRISEVLGLHWEDIDLNCNMIKVRFSTAHVRRERILTTPKTKSSIRSIHVPDLVIEVLKDRGQGDGLVFRTKNGKVAIHQDYHLDRLIAKIGIKKIRVHDLRHTFASLMLEDGVNPKIVQEILGHSTVSITLDLYSHSLPRQHQEVMSKWGEGFS